MKWLDRFKRTPKHDCRDFLPPGDRTPTGTRAVCPSCGALCERYNYDDDDLWGGTGTYCGWKRAQ